MPYSTVLIVDDDPLVRLLAEAQYRAFGATTVLSAHSGAQALELVSSGEHSFDLIQSDLNMPDMDGLQVMRGLAELQFSGGIVILSGEESNILKAAHNLARAHDLNLIGRLKKPLRSDELSHLLTKSRSAPRRPRRRSDFDIAPADIRAAIDRREIEAYFQPKIDLATGVPTGAEALARWNHPEKGLIAPDCFIPIAESAGLIGGLTWCILAQALEVNRAAALRGHSIKMALNTDAETLNELSFPDRIAETVKAAGVQPYEVTLEVTERGLLEDGACQIEVLTRLRMMQFDISIDDFGTGMSNIKQLCVFPFSELKIDKSFLTDFDSDRTRQVCLHAVVSLAQALDLRTVIEGVETHEELELVTGLGIDLAQGYLIAVPLPAGDFLHWLDQWSSNDGARPPARRAV